MSKLINFFFSFDKLMKESLVRAFFWLGLLNIGLLFFAETLDAIKLDWFAAVFEFVGFFAEFLLAIVILRLLAELAIAIFRMNDNLSPDGGKSETANIDPVAEARLAAENAAKRAQSATRSAVDRTSAATKSAAGRGKTAANDAKDTLGSKNAATSKTATKAKPQVEPVKKARADTASKTAEIKTAAAKKTTAKKAAVKKTVSKKTESKTSTAKTATKREPGMKLDGTPRKKPGPKKSS